MSVLGKQNHWFSIAPFDEDYTASKIVNYTIVNYQIVYYLIYIR